ncbi:PREDICTED: rho guanine nucleotide exchange factor 28-like [Priapulus caudatus]|uniref:Rho guanine nucleotide exchange factor 28-like n=1 Tax=Priapulus caudatus TaxID=37621 RepID=A0ABM1DU37_PRICU|nr:PREDICTED: rho guanine nucleotide exchange factor 28-like [Priapulus caudatus]
MPTDCLLTVHESCQDDLTTCIHVKKSLGGATSQFYASAVSASSAADQIAAERQVYHGIGRAGPGSAVSTSQVLLGDGRAGAQKKNIQQQHSVSTGALLGSSLERSATSRSAGESAAARSLASSTINSVRSASMESLEDSGSLDRAAREDPDLKANEHEPEAWSLTVDKKMLKKMSAKDIKRQDVIFELIQTEKHHCRTLKVMQKIFLEPMRIELNFSNDIINRVFPNLDELLELHTAFLQNLRERQRHAAAIDEIGDILVEFFGGASGEGLKHAYGNFCARRLEADAEYKLLLKTDRKFQAFVACAWLEIKTWEERARVAPAVAGHAGSNRLKSPSSVCDFLARAMLVRWRRRCVVKCGRLLGGEQQRRLTFRPNLDLDWQVLRSIDEAIAYHERQKRLVDIYNRIDSKSVGIFKGGRGFKKSDLLSGNRKLLHEGRLYWKTARGKLIEVLAILLTDVIFFLQESNQKYQFVSQDGKSGVVSLQKLLVREKAGKEDSCGLYLLSSNRKDPEMYEMVCPSNKRKKLWIASIRSAVETCPPEDEDEPTEMQQLQRGMAARAARLKEVTEELSRKDRAIAVICDERVKLVERMLEAVGRADAVKLVGWTYSSDDDARKLDVKEISHQLLLEVTHMSAALTGGSGLYRSASSAAEYESCVYISPALPKRAETFGGFDSPAKEPAAVKAESQKKSKICSPLALGRILRRDSPVRRHHTIAGERGGGRGQHHQHQQQHVRRAATLIGSPDADAIASVLKKRVSGTPGLLRDEAEVGTASLGTNSDSGGSEQSVDTAAAARVQLRRRDSDADIKDRISVGQKENRVSRRSSSFLPEFFQQKQRLVERSSDEASDKHVAGEQLTVGGAPLPLIMTPTKESAASALQVTHYINALLNVLIQQHTELETLRVQLMQSQDQMGRMTTENSREAKERKSQFRANQQLEELRNLQETINKERVRHCTARRRYSATSTQQRRSDIQKLKYDSRVEQRQSSVLWRGVRKLVGRLVDKHSTVTCTTGTDHVPPRASLSGAVRRAAHELLRGGSQSPLLATLPAGAPARRAASASCISQRERTRRAWLTARARWRCRGSSFQRSSPPRPSATRARRVLASQQLQRRPEGVAGAADAADEAVKRRGGARRIAPDAGAAWSAAADEVGPSLSACQRADKEAAMGGGAKHARAKSTPEEVIYF